MNLTGWVVAAAIILSGCGVGDPNRSAVSPSAPERVADSAVSEVASSPPVRLRIPALGVDAPVDPLETEADGTQGVPDELERVGWWSPGARPGGPGSVALVGHTKATGGGVFDDLGELAVGSVVEVQTATGVLRYQVTTIQEIPVAEFSRFADDLYRTDGEPVVTLMTCGHIGEVRATTIVVRAGPAAA